MIDALSAERGISVSAASTLQGLVIANGSAAGNGGGLNSAQPVTLSGMTVVSNSASGTDSSSGRGGGAYFWGTASVSGSTFVSNISGQYGGGAWFQYTTSVSGSEFKGNVAGSRGGGAFFYAAADVNLCAFAGNTAYAGSGALFNSGSSEVVNSLFAQNVGATGIAVYVDGTASLSLIQNSLAHSGTIGHDAIYAGSSGTVRLTNTLFSSYWVGIERFSGSVFEDYSLFSDVNTPYVGSITSGGHSITGTAGFVNPDVDDYHLGPGSAAIDAGVNAGIASDFEGTPRPIAAGFDIGNDESTRPPRAWLPLLRQ